MTVVEFVFGHSRKKKRSYIIEKMKEELDAGRKILLIAPEQQALMWDSLVASSLPSTVALRVETLSFTRLADSAFRRFGGCAKNYITSQKKTLIMWRAVNSVKAHLKVYGRGREDRYVPILLKAVSEAMLYSQTPESLMKASEALRAEGREEGIAAKLHDLSLIWSAYSVLLHDKYDDPEEIPDALSGLLDRENYFEGYFVIIDSFYTLTPKERNIVRRIFRDAEGACVTFAITRDGGDMPHTEHIENYRKALELTAARAGKKVEYIDLDEGEVPSELEYLRENLWDYSASPYQGDASAVKLYTCGDRHDEAAVCASVIWNLIENGASYSDIAVVAADVEKLRSVLDVHLEAMGIPVYMSAKSDLLGQSVIRLILSAVRVGAYGWRREDVISCAKTALTGLEAEESDALEKYAEKWRLRGKRAFCCEGWNMNPDGYTDCVSEWGEKLLRLANDAREKLVPPIEELAGHLNGTVREAAAAVYKMLCDFSVYSQIMNEARELRSIGEGARAQELEQVWTSVCSILDTLAEASGEEKTDAVRFAHMIEKTAAETEIGTIPDSLDRVVISSAGSARLDGVRHMIILGACEGEFPATPGDNGFFTQRDKDVLAPLGIELSPGMDSRRSEELFRFYAAVTAPDTSLSIIMPKSGDDGAMRPSMGARRIIKLLPKLEIKENAHLDWDFILCNEASARYFLPQLRGTEYGAAIERLLGEENMKNESLAVGDEAVSGETALQIFGDKMYLSQSRLETFKDCPQRYYLQYVLRLDEGGEAKMAPSDVGTFVHKILEDFLREVRDKGVDFPMDKKWTEETVKELIDRYIAAVSPENAGERLGYMFRRITRSIKLYVDSLDAEFSQSQFRPYDFEMKVGIGNQVPPMEIELGDGGVMSMIGVVDRLDVYRLGEKVFVRVVDYKTNNKVFRLDDVLEGRNVQLLLYLFSVCGCGDCGFRRQIAPNGEELVPAGAVYFAARPGETSADKPVSEDEASALVSSGISRTGIVLRDEGIIRAMEPDGQGKFIPVTFNRDGSISKRSSTADREEMDGIKEKLCEALRQTGIEMKSGRAAATPLHEDGESPCKYCKMCPVCRVDS